VPSFGGSRRWRGLGVVVFVESALVVARHVFKDAQVCIGHFDVSLCVGKGSATARATGRLSERASSETRRNPRTCSALRTG
jgi:hypothetical protein